VLCVAVVARAQVRLEHLDEQLGPFDIGGQKFTVMLHKKRAAGGIDPDSQQTLARVEIRDASGRLHFERTLPFQLSGAEFQYTVDATAEILQGTRHSAFAAARRSVMAGARPLRRQACALQQAGMVRRRANA
jgi:hypothetical protein